MRRAIITLTVAALMGAASLPSAPPAAATGSFTFDGSGYGHGLGMSQWGSFGLAKMGWSYGKILRHFYQRTEVQRDREVPGRTGSRCATAGAGSSAVAGGVAPARRSW
jgi:hypothetical protein